MLAENKGLYTLQAGKYPDCAFQYSCIVYKLVQNLDFGYEGELHVKCIKAFSF